MTLNFIFQEDLFIYVIPPLLFKQHPMYFNTKGTKLYVLNPSLFRHYLSINTMHTLMTVALQSSSVVS